MLSLALTNRIVYFVYLIYYFFFRLVLPLFTGVLGTSSS